MPSKKISKSKVKKLLEDFGADYFGKNRGFDIWTKGVTVIRINGDNGPTDWEIFYEIAHEQLEISDWDIDLWCGQNNC